MFFAYAILTPDECTLFCHPTSLDESVRDYLHKNGVAVLDYQRIWQSLESLGDLVKAQRAQKFTDGKTSSKEDSKRTDRSEKIVKTDKILLGNKSSWAVAKALGEVRTSQDSISIGRTMRRRGDLW